MNSTGYTQWVPLITLSALNILLIIVAKGLLALAPAHMAKCKGRKPGIWWVYGFFLFTLSIVHIAILPVQDPNQPQPVSKPPVPPANPVQPAPQQNSEHRPNKEKPSETAEEALRKCKAQLDRGEIEEDEYEYRKSWILLKSGKNK